MREADKQEVGRALRVLVEQAELSVYRVSQETGIARATLARIFEGAATGEERYAQVAAFLGTSVSELLGSEEAVAAHELREEHLATLGGRLKAEASRQGMTQTELATRMGKRQSYISRLYRGRFKGLSGYRAMAEALDVDLDVMLREVMAPPEATWALEEETCVWAARALQGRAEVEPTPASLTRAAEALGLTREDVEGLARQERALAEVERQGLSEAQRQAIGARLEALAGELGLDRDAVAARAGVGAAVVTRVWSGTLKTSANYVTVADALGLGVEVLLATPAQESKGELSEVAVLRAHVEQLSRKVDRVLELLEGPAAMVTVFDRGGVTYGVSSKGLGYRLDEQGLRWERVPTLDL